MPIMANALAQFGSKQNCIGSLGYPSINPLFDQMPSNCRLFSFANPGLTKALEFSLVYRQAGFVNSIFAPLALNAFEAHTLTCVTQSTIVNLKSTIGNTIFAFYTDLYFRLVLRWQAATVKNSWRRHENHGTEQNKNTILFST